MIASRTRLRAALLACFCAALSIAAWARGDEWSSTAYKGWTVQAVRIEGMANEDLARDLKDGLALALRQGFLGRGRPTFYPQTLDEDIRRTRLFLARRGYPHATVGVRFEGNAKRETVVVVFDIRLGDPVIVSSVVIDGIDGELIEKTRDDVKVKKGEVFRDAHVNESTSRLLKTLRESGYAHAQVTSSIEWIDSTTVGVHLDVESNGLFYFGDVSVEGAPEDLVPLVKKTARIRSGRLYSPKTIDNAHKNLRVLDLFRQVRFVPKESAPDTLDVVVEVIMREPRTIDMLVSYFNDELLKVGARWTHRNLLKKGRGVQLAAQASKFLQEVRPSVWWPGLVLPRTRLVFALKARRENEASYEAVSYGGDISVRYAYSLETALRSGIEVEDITIDVKGDTALTDLQDGLKTVLFAMFDHNAANDWIMPTEGRVLRSWVRWAPGGRISDAQFISGEAMSIFYVPLPANLDLALRGVLGLGRPMGKSSDLLPTERFYSGGANSMRGFSRRRLGPKNEANDPVGGEMKFEAGVELRSRLFWKLSGTLFTDVGQVWAKYGEAKFADIEVAVGPGIWFNTIVGPLRLDYAHRLTNYDKYEPRAVWHFSIGPAF